MPDDATADLNAMATFVAVAEARGFRAAGARLGVSGSAVSQALRRLEARLGVALVRRTTRSAHLTEAGERLYARARPALEELRAAAAALGDAGAGPRGTLRLHVATAAEGYLGAPLLADFLAAHPHVRVVLVVSDEPLDVVAAGFDAGVRLGEVIDRDMVAVPVTGDMRLVVVGAPAYLARRPPPAHPRDLVAHECIGWQTTSGAAPYRWEFTEPGPDGAPGGGREFSVDVRARVLTSDPALNLRLAVAGAGLTLASEGRARDAVARGDLVPVLEAYSAPFPGFYLYYPARQHASPALRAFAEHLRRGRRTREGGSREGGSRERGAPDTRRPTPAGAPAGTPP